MNICGLNSYWVKGKKSKEYLNCERSDGDMGVTASKHILVFCGLKEAVCPIFPYILFFLDKTNENINEKCGD